MFLPAFHDLLKPQWLAALSELKVSGGMAISDLSKKLGTSYMTVKQHCEDLTKLGYLDRTRVPRTEIGRPEIFYRLSEKANGLFPSAPVSFTLEVLTNVRNLFGNTAPDKMLFQHFQNLEGIWKGRLVNGSTLLYKSQLFVRIREKEGLFIRHFHDPESGDVVLKEFHHPLQSVFENYPRAITMEQRAIEAALGVKVSRVEVPGLNGKPTHVEFRFKA